jgi:hypothetical protein
MTRNDALQVLFGKRDISNGLNPHRYHAFQEAISIVQQIDTISATPAGQASNGTSANQNGVTAGETANISSTGLGEEIQSPLNAELSKEKHEYLGCRKAMYRAVRIFKAEPLLFAIVFGLLFVLSCDIFCAIHFGK